MTFHDQKNNQQFFSAREHVIPEMFFSGSDKKQDSLVSAEVILWQQGRTIITSKYPNQSFGLKSWDSPKVPFQNEGVDFIPSGCDKMHLENVGFK